MRKPLVLAALFVASGCSSGGGGGAFMPPPGGGGPGEMKPVEPTYPEGPYGNKVDDTLANFAMQGLRLSTEHTDPSEIDWAKDIKLAEFLEEGGVAPDAQRKCKCLLITWGAGWCGACKQEQPQLKLDIEDDPDFCVLNILQEGNAQGPPATQEDVEAWADRYKQNFYVALGTPYTKNLWKGHARNGVISLPFNFIVRTSDMKVVETVQGYRKDIHSYSMDRCSQ